MTFAIWPNQTNLYHLQIILVNFCYYSDISGAGRRGGDLTHSFENTQSKGSAFDSLVQPSDEL